MTVVVLDLAFLLENFVRAGVARLFKTVAGVAGVQHLDFKVW